MLCTTGLSEAQIKKVKETAEKNSCTAFCQYVFRCQSFIKAGPGCGQSAGSAGFDIEIVEKHHNQKKDAPSGTALALADSMNEALGDQYHYVYDRSSVHEKRDPKEIGIASVRGGSIVGDHDVIFAGKDEVITFNHTAYSKAIFAKGALEAAKFLAGKEPGLYDMSDVVQL